MDPQPGGVFAPARGEQAPVSAMNPLLQLSERRCSCRREFIPDPDATLATGVAVF